MSDLHEQALRILEVLGEYQETQDLMYNGMREDALKEGSKCSDLQFNPALTYLRNQGYTERLPEKGLVCIRPAGIRYQADLKAERQRTALTFVHGALIAIISVILTVLGLGLLGFLQATGTTPVVAPPCQNHLIVARVSGRGEVVCLQGSKG